MSKLIKMQRVWLKDHTEINEAAIQAFIYNDPSVLGIGNLIPVEREKVQPSGGRLDILLSDEEESERYEVEILLGPTDPSHIIRTIEYWDYERKRSPRFNHCAVIVAEEITGRFLNVISLFNGAIPLIALQMSAYKVGDDLMLTFTKVLDRVVIDDEETSSVPPADKSYWEKKSSKKAMELTEKLFSFVSPSGDGYELKFNRPYIGVSKDNVAKNFIQFIPHKQFVAMFIRTDEDRTEDFEDRNLDIDYVGRKRSYRIRIKNEKEYEENKEFIIGLVSEAKKFYGLAE